MVTVADYEQAEVDLIVTEERLGWRIHAAVFAVVMTGLAALNLVIAARTGADTPWFVFPLVCWGIGLAVHHRYATRWVVRDIRGHQDLIERTARPR